MNDTMSSGEDGSDRDDEAEGSDSATDRAEPEPEEELDDTASDGSTDGGDGSDAAPDDQAGEEAGEPDEPDRELAKVAGGNPPDPKKLDEVDEKIRSARSTAEEVVVGVRDDDQPDYHESGEEKPADADEEPADDQAITPPG